MVFPESIGDDLDLSGLTSAKRVVLPKSVGRDVDLGSLVSLDGITLPDYIEGDLILNSVASISDTIAKELAKFNNVIINDELRSKINRFRE
jgi:hypothetical protein